MLKQRSYQLFTSALAICLALSTVGVTLFSFNCISEDIHLTSFTEIDHTCKALAETSCHSTAKDECSKDCCSQEVELKKNNQVNNSIQNLDIELGIEFLPVITISEPVLFHSNGEKVIRPPPDISSSGRSVVIALQQFLC